MLPFFHHVYFGGTHTLLRFAEQFARVHGVETHFHCYDVGHRPDAGRCRPRWPATFPSLANATFTSGSLPDRRDLPESDAVIATLVVKRVPGSAYREHARQVLLRARQRTAVLPGRVARRRMVEETYRFGLPGIVNTPGLADVYASYGNPAVSFVPAVDLDRYHPPTEPRDPNAPVRVFFYARARICPELVWARHLVAGVAEAPARRSRRDRLCRRGLEPRPVRAAWQDLEPGRARHARRGRRRSIARATSAWCSCRPSTPAISHSSSWHPAWQPFRTSTRRRAGSCAMARTACSRRLYRRRRPSAWSGSSRIRSCVSGSPTRASSRSDATAGPSRSSRSGTKSASRTAATWKR